MIILGTEQKVYHEHGDRSTCHDHESEAYEEESEHVVDLASPDAVHDEVQLHEDGPKRKDSNKEHTWDRSHIATRRRNLAWNLVCPDGCRNLRTFEADPGPSERQWQ